MVDLKIGVAQFYFRTIRVDPNYFRMIWLVLQLYSEKSTVLLLHEKKKCAVSAIANANWRIHSD